MPLQPLMHNLDVEVTPIMEILPTPPQPGLCRGREWTDRAVGVLMVITHTASLTKLERRGLPTHWAASQCLVLNT